MQRPMTIEEKERIEQLRRAGCSMAVIAHTVGRTRNSICGYIHRNGLSDKRRKNKSNSAAALIKRLRKEQQVPMLKPTKADRHALKNPEFCRHDGILMIDLIENQCRWPVTQDKPFKFCAEHTRGPYCEYHANIAYNTTSKKYAA